MKLRRILTAAAAVLGTVATVTLVAPQVASAHHATLTGSASRPCGADAPWTATWSATSWNSNDNKDWRNRYQIQLEGSAPGNWVPGPYTYGDWLDVSATFGPHSIPDLGADVEWVQVRLRSEFRDVGKFDAWPYPLQINRPEPTTCPTTTTTSTTTTTTTMPETTTTTTTEPGETTTTTTEPGDTTTTTEPGDTTTTTESAQNPPPGGPTTTAGATTTTEVAQNPPPGNPTTTALVVPTTGGAGPGAPELPSTGSDSAGRLAGIGSALLAAGTAIVLLSRRRAGSTSDVI